MWKITLEVNQMSQPLSKSLERMALVWLFEKILVEAGLGLYIDCVHLGKSLNISVHYLPCL